MSARADRDGAGRPRAREGILEGIRPGALYIDHTTNSPLLVRRVHAALQARGVDMLDAPVSGGTEGAQTRDLLVMVGGEPAVFERARPILDALAERVRHVGPIGCGAVCKILHNCASFTLDLTMAECWTVAVKAGVAPETIVDVFKHAALGQMMSLNVRLPATYLRGDFDPRFALKLARKDLGLALELARAYDTPMRLGAFASRRWWRPWRGAGPTATPPSSSPSRKSAPRSRCGWEMRVADVPIAIQEASRRAQSGRPRPTVVEIPPDVLAAEAEVTLAAPEARTPAAPDAESVR